MPVVKSISTVDGEEIAIYIEVEKLPETESPYGETRGDVLEQVTEAARDMFQDGIALAHTCAKQAVAGIKKMDTSFRPEEFEVKLAIKLDSTVGAILAQVSAGAQMEVTMKWKPRGSMGATQP